MATFRGYPACSCLIAWLPVYEAELLRRGVIKYNIDIYQLIGGAAASGGTHSKGGAFDVGQTSREAIVVARQMGADATWHRPYNWDGRGGMSHTHGVLRDCPHNGPARYQIRAVDAGYNGLGYLGHAKRDDGPRPLSGRTYRQGIAWAKARQGDEFDMASLDDLRQIIREEVSGDIYNAEGISGNAANNPTWYLKSLLERMGIRLEQINTMVNTLISEQGGSPSPDPVEESAGGADPKA